MAKYITSDQVCEMFGITKVKAQFYVIFVKWYVIKLN